MRNVLILLAILAILLEFYGLLRGYWVRNLLVKKKKARRPRKPAVLQPKSERDCPFCREAQEKRAGIQREGPIAWWERKGRGGRKKRISTAGYFCPNQACEYYGVTDAYMHALVGDGTHGKQEVIQGSCPHPMMHLIGENEQQGEHRYQVGADDPALTDPFLVACIDQNIEKPGNDHDC